MGREFLIRTTRWRLRRGVGMSSFDSITRALGLVDRRREGEGVTGHRDVGVGHYSVCYAQHDLDLRSDSSTNLLDSSTKCETCREQLP